MSAQFWSVTTEKENNYIIFYEVSYSKILYKDYSKSSGFHLVTWTFQYRSVKINHHFKFFKRLHSYRLFSHPCPCSPTSCGVTRCMVASSNKRCQHITFTYIYNFNDTELLFFYSELLVVVIVIKNTDRSYYSSFKVHQVIRYWIYLVHGAKSL